MDNKHGSLGACGDMNGLNWSSVTAAGRVEPKREGYCCQGVEAKEGAWSALTYAPIEGRASLHGTRETDETPSIFDSE
ncbi:hypothetical protein BOTBODRAFT_323932 [Botryobasidium botryosum FD-172 SS1]|uniref:Uncharacterized protein n=1 Tax=Botryobasidium botryosum (strain FD-172 SS1) TaxID=930990 RepID=A0A067NA13_BOTB1|nr:hypothetical protein BOTBODRAFT_323932 [Botryobasidium botryosum FD-172 SS1]